MHHREIMNMHSMSSQGLLTNRHLSPVRSGSIALVFLLLAGVLSAINAGSGAELAVRALGSAAERGIAQQPTAPQTGAANRQMRQPLSGGSSQAGRDEYGYVFVPVPLSTVSGTVIVTQSAGRTLVSEGEVTDTFSIVLSAAPTSDVSIAVGAGVPSAGTHQLLFTTALTQTATNTAFLTFTSTNYATPQSVTVSAVNDAFGEGRHSARITGYILSPTTNYLYVDVPSFTAEIEDNDPTLLLTESAASTDVVEGGFTDTYSVSLSTQPTNTVVVIPGGASPAQFTYSPSSVTFSTTNYDVPQVITVTANDDSTVEGYHTALITHTITGFNNLPSPYIFTNREQAAPTSITANINDNDGNVAIVESGTSTHTVRSGETLPSIALQYGVVLETLLLSNPGVTAELLKTGDVLQLPINNTTRTVVREGGGITDTYTVFLLTAPTGNVSVTLGDGMNALQVTPSGTDPGYSHDVTFTTAETTTATSTVTLTFTPANYSTPQTVTVLALDDALKEGVEKISITHHVRSVSNTGASSVVIDSTYNAASANRVIATVLDNDVGIATMGADFDGDGKTDYAIYRGGTAQYFVRKSLDSSTEVVTWGDMAQADRPVPADYDGDGKSDYAVYRPGTAQFLVRKSSTGIAEVVTWGIAGGGDRPAVADFDGDGRVDYAIYRSTTAAFIVKNSATNTTAVVIWGVANGSDTPVVGDYDGDGKADYAVYRRPTAQWLIKQSSNGSVVVTAWGMARSADIPVPGDYDGDGKTDRAIFRPETAEFFVLQSANAGLAVTRWGIAGGSDVPVPGDYDGDGKMDKAIFRPATAAFIVQKSSTLTPVDPPTTWGVAGGFDYPLPVPDPNFDGTVYGFIGQ
jgi:LysM repeat protein